MKLRIVGSGCPTCKQLHERVKKLVLEQGITAEVDYSTDIDELIEAGAVSSPGIFKDGELVSTGSPDDKELLKIIKG